MSDVVPDGSGKFLKVKFIQRKDCAALESAYLMDEVRRQTLPYPQPQAQAPTLSPKPGPLPSAPSPSPTAPPPPPP